MNTYALIDEDDNITLFTGESPIESLLDENFKPLDENVQNALFGWRIIVPGHPVLDENLYLELIPENLEALNEIITTDDNHFEYTFTYCAYHPGIKDRLLFI